MTKIPIILVTDSYAEVTVPSTFRVLASFTALDVIVRNGEVNPNTEIAVIDLRGIDRAEMIRCGILLRNAGRTVVVCDPSRLPVELIAALHRFSVDARRKGKAIKTELLFIEEAIEAATEVPNVEKLN